MLYQKGQSGNPGGRHKSVVHVRNLARQYTAEAVNTLVRWMRQKKHPHAAVAAATAILDRGWGKPFHDPADGEHINITIRKILEGSVTEVEPSPAKEVVTIEHDATESEDDQGRGRVG